MQISELLSMDREGLTEHGPIVIVALGDSVTHGMFDRDCADHESVYHNRLRQMLNAYKPYIPVCVINAGIGGTTAKQALARLERDVLSHHPDLVTVCFGLNDVNYPLDEYIDSMREILVRCRETVENVIVVTPNMLNTTVSPETEAKYMSYAAVTAEMQNGGKMDTYMDAVRALAAELSVPVCDVYGEWRRRSLREDMTAKLANHINHPTPEMHELKAKMLFDMLIKDGTAESAHEDGMIRL